MRPRDTRSRRRTLIRCARCRMPAPICLCAGLPRLGTGCAVVLVPHRVEWRRASNTGRLAVLCLCRSELAIYGARETPLDPALLHRPGHRHVMLYPGEDAPPLRPDPSRPTRLIVPDGSWRQTARMARVIRAHFPDTIELARVEATPLRALRRMPSAARLSTGAAIVAATRSRRPRRPRASTRRSAGWSTARSSYAGSSPSSMCAGASTERPGAR